MGFKFTKGFNFTRVALKLPILKFGLKEGFGGTCQTPSGSATAVLGHCFSETINV